MAKKQAKTRQGAFARLAKELIEVSVKYRALVAHKERVWKNLQRVCRHPDGIESDGATEPSAFLLAAGPMRCCRLCGLTEKRNAAKPAYRRLARTVCRKLPHNEFLTEQLRIDKTIGYAS